MHAKGARAITGGNYLSGACSSGLAAGTLIRSAGVVAL
jgi:hypothetical protein